MYNIDRCVVSVESKMYLFVIYLSPLRIKHPLTSDLSTSVFRTESVAEKMLTNWFTFLLHRFLKVTHLRHPHHLHFLLPRLLN